jgi:hypothetical protein
MAGIAAQEPTKVIFRFFTLNDGYRELGSANGRYRATTSNVGTWSSPGVHLVEVPSVQPTVGHQRQRQVWGEQFEIL